MKETEEKVLNILAGAAGKGTDEVGPATTFEELELDSLDLVELMVIIEDELGLQIDEDDMKDFVTVQDAIDKIEEKAALSK